MDEFRNEVERRVRGEAFQRNVDQAKLDQEDLWNVPVCEPRSDHRSHPNPHFGAVDDGSADFSAPIIGNPPI
jgi:hypothetical protein